MFGFFYFLKFFFYKIIKEILAFNVYFLFGFYTNLSYFLVNVIVSNGFAFVSWFNYFIYSIWVVFLDNNIYYKNTLAFVDWANSSNWNYSSIVFFYNYIFVFCKFVMFYLFYFIKYVFFSIYFIAF